MAKYKGYVFVLLAVAGWGFMGLFNRTLAAGGVDLPTTLVIRNTGSLVLLTIIFLIFRRCVFRIHLRHLPTTMPIITARWTSLCRSSAKQC